MDQAIPQISERDRLYLAMGKAMESWGFIEMNLAVHFRVLTGMQPGMANVVFSSPRNLRGKLDMLEDVVNCGIEVRAIPSMLPFVKTACKRIGQWSSVRNMLAHSKVYIVPHNKSKYFNRPVLTDTVEIIKDNPEKLLAVEHIEIAESNFRWISTLLVASHSHPNGLSEQLLAECLALVRLLPVKAQEDGLSQSTLKRLSQLIPAGEHRAAEF